MFNKKYLGILAITLCIPFVVSGSTLAAEKNATMNGLNKFMLCDPIISTAVEKIRLMQKTSLADLQIGILKNRNYSDEFIAKLTSEEFEKLEKTWTLSAETISSNKIMYSELITLDMSNWTYEKLAKYQAEKDYKTYAPSKEQQVLLLKRGVTVEMAMRMIKEFFYYDNMINCSDEKLNEVIDATAEADRVYCEYWFSKNTTKD